MINLLLFFLIITVVVFVHELGHFMMAKKNGVTVHEFAIGMGPIVFSKTKNGTKYSLRMIPIGGFVKMEGEEEESDQEGSFTKKSPLARLVILLAGIFNNFLLGFILLLLFFSMTGVTSNTIEVPVSDSPAHLAGMLGGDRIVEIDNHKTESWEDIVAAISSSEGRPLKMLVMRKATADGVERELHISLSARQEETTGRWIIGIRPRPVKQFGEVFPFAVSSFFGMLTGIFGMLPNLFKSEVAKDLVGPIGLYQVVDDVRQMGIVNLIFLTGFISINIGVINLLPIPAFDGGRALMVLAEMITGKPLNRKLESALIMSGFVIIMLLVVFTFYNDIARLLG